MRFPSFERSENNPFSPDTEPMGDILNTSDKKEVEKKKETEEEGKKRLEDEKTKNEKTKDSEKSQKDTKKSEKEKKATEETLETKKIKRKQLVERSLHYKKLYEEVPIPRDPWVVARLMVADHLLALNTRIEQPEINSAEELRLLANFDYMGIIATKLENPEIESSPEIEETCEMIVQLAEETLQEDTPNTIENLVAANAESARSPIEETLPKESETTLPRQTAPSDLSPQGTALITVLLHARQSTLPQYSFPPQQGKEKSPPLRSTTTGGDAASSATQVPQHKNTINESVPAPHLERPIQADYRTPEREVRLASPRVPEALAGLAVAAVLTKSLGREQPLSRIERPPLNSVPRIENTSHTLSTPSPSHSPPHPARPAATSFVQSRDRVTPAYSSRPLETKTSFEPHPQIHRAPEHEHAPHSKPSTSSHEIEHLPLHSLLEMAETVSIGHGQRLRSAFEKGAIDKDGLVKVLKSHKKQHDFLREYKQQVVRRHNLVQSSPEFLTASPTNTKMHQTVEPNVTPDQPASKEPMITSQPPSMPSWPEFPNLVKNTPGTDPFNLHEPTPIHSAWFNITKLGLLILGIGILVTIYLIFR